MDRILHLEDSASDAHLLALTLRKAGIDCEIAVAARPDDFRKQLASGDFSVVLSDSGVPGLSARQALELVRRTQPAMPFICVSGAARPGVAAELLAAGATDYVLKSDPERVIAAVRHGLRRHEPSAPGERDALQLVSAVQQLSTARDLATVQQIVRRAARDLSGADGATFVLRDGNRCYYADEDAIAPLWKGQRFPMSSCISGWVMQHGEAVVISDIYADRRIPASAYRSTFVKSVAMVPIRSEAPLGAIGAYWAKRHAASRHEMELLQALADTTAVAMENIAITGDLERRVCARTAEFEAAREKLQAANAELETFSYSVSHDLRAPLRAINGFSSLAAEALERGRLDEAREMFARVQAEANRMHLLIEDLLELARVSQAAIRREPVDLGMLARSTLDRLAAGEPGRNVQLAIDDGLEASADAGLAASVVENLLSNAWKYSSKAEHARIQFRREPLADGASVFVVEDNGVGFDMEHSEKLFRPFNRLHLAQDYPGTGVGLAIVQRIVEMHGGRIWLESAPGKGTTARFTLGD